MRGSKTIFLFICVFLLGGYIWFVEKNRLSPAEQKAVDRQAFDLSMDRVDLIGIRSAQLEVEMVHNGVRWMLSEPAGARASEAVVQQLLARFRSLSRGEFITPADMRSRSLTLADFGLEVPQMILTLGVEGQQRVYSVGSPNPLGTSLYVKEESSQNVMLVSSDLLEILPPDIFLFRDSEIFPVVPSDVREVALVSSAGTLRLQRERDAWMMVNPVRARANAAKVEQLLTKLGRARIEGVHNRPDSEMVEAFQSGGDLEVIRLWPHTQAVPVEVQIGGGVPGNPQRNLAKILGQDGMIEVSKGLQVLAETPPEALRDRSVMILNPKEIRSLEISGSDRTILLEKINETWRMREPFDLPASGAKIQQVLSQWNSALVEAFLPMASEAAPGGSLGKVTFRGGPATSPSTFTLLAETSSPGRAYLQKEGTDEVLQVVPDVVKFIPRDPLAYVSKRVLSIDASRTVRLSVQHQGNEMTALRPNAASPWTLRSGSSQVESMDVEAVLSSLSSLFADQVEAYSPDRVSDAATRISIGLGGTSPENITLVVAEDGVWLQGRDVTYVLSEAVRENLLAACNRFVSLAPDSSHGVEDSP